MYIEASAIQEYSSKEKKLKKIGIKDFNSEK